ncbi:MAG: hypothetical protein LW701_07575 [Fluviicola sp.]|jgi:hypothetical protein|nr:hypothetical protein [Fluviicola sp.]
MKEKVKIESINKVAQIDSIDVHANSVVCDLKLDVEKIVSASSEKFRDEESAKTNSYQKAKAEFGVDVIVDSSFVIRKTTEISTTGWVGIVLLILGPILIVTLDPPNNFMLGILCEIIGSICLMIGVNRFYTAVISGYAGYYKNARNYYDQQKDNMLSTAKAVNNAFSETPSLNLEERKILDLIRQNNITDSTLNTEQLQVWKKNKRIENKSDQTEVFYSVIYPNATFGTPSKGIAKLLKNRKRGSGSSSSIKKIVTNFLTAAIVSSVLFFTYNYIAKKYRSYKFEKEMEQNMLQSNSEHLTSIIIDCEKAIKDMNPANIDSAKVASITWSYKPDDYSDSVERYDEIRSKIMIDFNKVIGKIKAEEKAKNIKILLASVDEIIGDYTGSKDGKDIEIEIFSINKFLKVKAECRYYKLDESTYENYVSETKQLTGSVDFKDGKVVFTFIEPGNKSTDGKFVLNYDYNSSENLNGEWISKINENKKFSIWLSEKVIEPEYESYYPEYEEYYGY